MAIYFISDLHLQPERPALAQIFYTYLDQLQQTGDAEALYILGDFFEVWVGDDFSSPFIDDIKAALKRVSDSGIQVFFMHGNRDFLVGEAFCQQTGMTLLDDPCVIQLGDQALLLAHGDALCTDDVDYMKMRGLFRNPNFQTTFLARPLEDRLDFARQIRSESQQGQQMKSDDIMDANQSAVDTLMSEHQVHQLLHGHTHRPQVHEWEHDGSARTRYVLGDWSDTTGWQIRWDSETGLELTSFSY